MKQRVIYTQDQIKEMEVFYDCCVTEGINFDNYSDICNRAKVFIKNAKESAVKIQSHIALLSFSALVKHRGDDLDKIVVRDFKNSKSVRRTTIKE